MTTPPTPLPSGEASALDALPDAVLTFDGDRRIVDWNRAAESLYGYPRDVAVGTVVSQLLRTSYPVPLSEIIDTVADSGSWRGFLIQRTRDGRELRVESHWSARRDPNDGPGGAVCVERSAPEPPRSALPEPQAQPAAPDHLGQLVGAAAHDFNNLLAVIINYAALAAAELEALNAATGEERLASIRSDVGEIRIAATRATQLTRTLLAAARNDTTPSLPDVIGEPSDEQR